MSIYDAAIRYIEQDVPLVVLGGKEYGSGSSRDWAAKGTKLLGVRAVIVESFERIHRSNLVGMGVLPLQFPEGQSADSLGLTGEEVFSIEGMAETMNVAAHPHRRRARCRFRPARWRRAREFSGSRADRHPPRGRILPTRGYSAVRLASTPHHMSPTTAKKSGAKSGGEKTPAGASTKVLLDLLDAQGPSGYETAPAAVWRDAAKGFATVSTDVVGTPLALVAPKHDARSRRDGCW